MATLGDLAKAIDADEAAVKGDQDAINSMQSSLAATQAALVGHQEKETADWKVLATALASTGGFFRINSDGTATAYEADPNAPNGVRVTVLSPDTTAVG